MDRIITSNDIAEYNDIRINYSISSENISSLDLIKGNLKNHSSSIVEIRFKNKDAFHDRIIKGEDYEKYLFIKNFKLAS